MLADWDGHVLETRSTATPRQALVPGEQAYPADVVLTEAESLVAGLAEAHPGDAIDTVVFSCLGTAMVPVDRMERPLGAALAPADLRPLSGVSLMESIDLREDALRQMTGWNPRVPSFLLHALWWQQARPEVMEQLHRFRSLRGFVLQALCGADAEDPSWASRSMLMDLRRPRLERGHPVGGAPAQRHPARDRAVDLELVLHRLGHAPHGRVRLRPGQRSGQPSTAVHLLRRVRSGCPTA